MYIYKTKNISPFLFIQQFAAFYLLLNSYTNTNYIIWPEPLIRSLMSFIHMSVELMIILK